jgi:UDP-2-acetamido-3-amino-2,3-dideoxy-glucuronate N-acetyltransferase
MLLALFGQEPVAVTGVGGSYLTNGIEDQYRLDLAFPNGASAYVFASWLHPFKEHRLVIVGSDAMAVFEDSAKPGEKLRLYRHRADTSRRPPELSKADAETIPHAAEEPLKRECQHFLDCIRDNRRPRTDAQEGLGVLRVLTKLDAKLAVADVA